MCDNDGDNNNVIENPEPEADSADTLAEDDLTVGDDVEADIRAGPSTVNANDIWPPPLHSEDAEVAVVVGENIPDVDRGRSVMMMDVRQGDENSDSPPAGPGNFDDDDDDEINNNNSVDIQPFLPVPPECAANTAPEDEMLENSTRDSEEKSVEDFEPECDQAVIVDDDDEEEEDNCDNVVVAAAAVEVVTPDRKPVEHEWGSIEDHAVERTCAPVDSGACGSIAEGLVSRNDDLFKTESAHAVVNGNKTDAKTDNINLVPNLTSSEQMMATDGCDGVAMATSNAQLLAPDAHGGVETVYSHAQSIAADGGSIVASHSNIGQLVAADRCGGVVNTATLSAQIVGADGCSGGVVSASGNEHDSNLQLSSVATTNNSNCKPVTQSTNCGDFHLDSCSLSPKSHDEPNEIGDMSSIPVTGEDYGDSSEVLETSSGQPQMVKNSKTAVASNILECSTVDQQNNDGGGVGAGGGGGDGGRNMVSKKSLLSDNSSAELCTNNATPVKDVASKDTQQTPNTLKDSSSSFSSSPSPSSSSSPVHCPDLVIRQELSCDVANLPQDRQGNNSMEPDAGSGAPVSSLSPDQAPSNVPTEHPDQSEDQLLDELEELLTPNPSPPQGGSQAFNGLTKIDINQIPEFLDLKQNFQSLKKELAASKQQVKVLESQTHCQQERLEVVKMERNSYRKELDTSCDSDLYLTQLKALEESLVQKDNEIRAAKERLSSQEVLAKKTIGEIHNEYKSKVHHLTKIAEDNKREKEEMVIKYAQAERKGLEMQKGFERLDGRLRENCKEKETLLTRFNALKVERQKYMARLESKSAEFLVVQREVEKQKENVTSCEGRLKWTQNKLAAEVESHKETKASLQSLNTKLKESKEECEQIRRDCQAIIRTYQESEEIKSNSLDNQLKAKQNELLCHEQERSDHQQIHQTVLKELELLKTQHKDLMEEMKTKKDKITCLEDECRDKEFTLSKFKDVLQNQKTRIKDLKTKVQELEDIKSQYDKSQEELSEVETKLSEQSQQCCDIKTDIDSCKVRESELLELTANLSAKNALLQSDNITVNNKVLSLGEELSVTREKLEELEIKCQELHKSLTEETVKRQEETTSLTSQLLDKSKSVEELGVQLEEARDDLRTLKRKHTNNIKDLTRQLTFTRRKLENYENTGEKDSTSLGSRTSSNGSLNTLDNNVQSTVIHKNGNPDQEYPVITEQVEVDKQVLIERIVKLQKAHARKNDKIEFMEDHINHLVDEIQKKKRIIQSYALREETGVLSTDYMDINKPSSRFYDQVSQLKAILSRKGGIMASLYSSQPADQSMTLDLSLEINKKLQSVLEDTLLKNITLKDSLDTLGKEISRLSRENRQLQLEQHSQ